MRISSSRNASAVVHREENCRRVGSTSGDGFPRSVTVTCSASPDSSTPHTTALSTFHSPRDQAFFERYFSPTSVRCNAHRTTSAGSFSFRKSAAAAPSDASSAPDAHMRSRSSAGAVTRPG
eukprot:scaffold5777_cov101-Isochrysis_galbana.AAC.3